MSIATKVPGFDDNQLLKLLTNALERLSDEKKGPAAREIVNAIKHEWSVRLARFREGTYSCTTPHDGMLSALGYHVGNHKGVATHHRRRILAYVLSGELPPVQSPAYMAEWGAPGSPRRLKKLKNVLRGLIESHQRNPHDYEKAISEWQQDLEFVSESLVSDDSQSN